MLMVFIYLYEQQSEKKEGGLPPTCSLPQFSQWPGLCWTKVESQELNPTLSRGWQEPSYISHHHCLPGFALAGS